MSFLKNNLLVAFLFALTVSFSYSQNSSNTKVDSNEDTKGNKGLNEKKDYDLMIGNCNCISVQYQGGKPGDTLKLKWKWRYILGGSAVQDEGWYGNDSIQNHFTSIRILNPKTKKWHVPFFTPNMLTDAQVWIGGRVGEKIVLSRTQETEKGSFESILTFSNISESGFDWEGKIFIPSIKRTDIFWKIWCKKITDERKKY